MVVVAAAQEQQQQDEDLVVLECPDGQVVMDVSEIMDPSILGSKSSSELNIYVTSPRYEEDSFEYHASSSYYYYNEQGVEEELPWESSFCVPADKCLVVKLAIRSMEPEDTIASSVSIMYDNVPYSLLLGPFKPLSEGSFRIDNAFFVEVGGNCRVTCEEDHILLEIEAVTDWSNSFSSMDLGNHVDWQVMDDATDEVIRTCPPFAPRPDNNTDTSNVTYSYFNNGCYWSLDGLFRDRVCIPNGGCYRLVAGASARDVVKTFQVTWDGDVLLHTQHFQFESLLLQHPMESSSSSSSSSSCNSVRPSCQEQSEGDMFQEEMEVFIFRNEVMDDNALNLTWNADYVVSGQLVSNVHTFVAGDRPLQYKRQCIPGCAFFYLSEEPQLIDGQNVSFWSYNAHLPYRIQANGIIYAEDDQSMYHYLPFYLSVSDVIGSSCQELQACDVRGRSGEFLVELDAHFQPELPNQMSMLDEEYSSSSTREPWLITQIRTEKEFRDNVESARNVYGVSGFGQPGKHYHKQICLDAWWYFQEGSDPDCTALEMNLDASHLMESYSVSVNGQVFGRTIDCSHKNVPLAYRRMCNWAYIQDRKWYTGSTSIEWTPLNGNCKKKGIPGIISSATVGGVLLVAGLWWYCRKRRRERAANKDRHDAAPHHRPYPAGVVVAMKESVAIPLERDHPPTTNLAQQQEVLEEDHHQNPHTVVAIEATAPQDDPTSGTLPTVTAAAYNDEEDFA